METAKVWGAEARQKQKISGSLTEYFQAHMIPSHPQVDSTV